MLWVVTCNRLFVRLNVFVGIRDRELSMCVPFPYRCHNNFLKNLEVRVQLNVTKRLRWGCDVINVQLQEAWTTLKAQRVQSQRWGNKPLYSLSHFGLSPNLILQVHSAWPASRGVMVHMVATGQLCTQQFMDDACIYTCLGKSAL